jgi:mevalonate pyrophosphate decarboxylase
MIDMALLSVLRCWHFRDGMPIREITCRTELSRNTVQQAKNHPATIEPAIAMDAGPNLKLLFEAKHQADVESAFGQLNIITPFR